MRIARCSSRLLGRECLSGGVCLGAEGLSGGVYPGAGVCMPACTWTDTPPVDRMTDTCENITLQQLRCER